ncbi:MAG TPA: alpha/beta hydrolase [Nitrososphaeraceae archaeon]|jgi:pimeloyl-ACP methyl ester carboxylesterase
MEYSTTNINDTRLEFTIVGSGQTPLVLIHGGIIADANIPIINQLFVSKRFRLFHYHRRGYAGSTHIPTDCSVSISKQADDCFQLIRRYFCIKGGAHILGHSVGGAIALQLAMDHPETVRTLSLLEPALTGYDLHNTRGSEVVTSFSSLIDMYDAGDKVKAIVTFMKSTIGPDYHNIIRELLPQDAFDMAVRDAETFFHQEIPAMETWPISRYSDLSNISTMTKEVFASIKQPILFVRGSDSGHVSIDRQIFLSKVVSQVEIAVIQKSKHMLQLMNPVELSCKLTSFLTKYSD